MDTFLICVKFALLTATAVYFLRMIRKGRIWPKLVEFLWAVSVAMLAGEKVFVTFAAGASTILSFYALLYITYLLVFKKPNLDRVSWYDGKPTMVLILALAAVFTYQCFSFLLEMIQSL